MAPTVKNLPAMQETPVRSLGQEDPLAKGIGQRNLVGYSPRGRKELDMTKRLTDQGGLGQKATVQVLNRLNRNFPGGPAVRNLPARGRNKGLIPHAEEPLSSRTTAIGPML